MIDILELADKFVTDLAAGNIESYLDQYVKANAIDTKGMMKKMDSFLETVKTYSQETDQNQKIQLAQSILDFSLHYRLIGLLKNNPNLTKHMLEQLDFYKERFKILEQEKAQHETEMATAMTAIKKLRGELIGKAMSG
jgi:uncharacterized protein (DUF927 family)